MIGLDTNVVVRYLVQDDLEQSAQASELIDALTESDPGYLSLVTVVELYWVLRTARILPTLSSPSWVGSPDAPTP